MQTENKIKKFKTVVLELGEYQESKTILKNAIKILLEDSKKWAKKNNKEIIKQEFIGCGDKTGEIFTLAITHKKKNEYKLNLNEKNKNMEVKTGTKEFKDIVPKFEKYETHKLLYKKALKDVRNKLLEEGKQWAEGNDKNITCIKFFTNMDFMGTILTLRITYEKKSHHTKIFKRIVAQEHLFSFSNFIDKNFINNLLLEKSELWAKKNNKEIIDKKFKDIFFDKINTKTTYTLEVIYQNISDLEFQEENIPKNKYKFNLNDEIL